MKSKIHSASKGMGGLHMTSGKAGTLLGRTSAPKTAMPSAKGSISGMNKKNQIMLGSGNKGKSSLRGD